MSETPRTDELAAIINRAKLDHGDMWYHEVIKWLKSELTAAKEKIATLEHSHTFCPHCNPCRRAAEITPLEDALRSLASYVGNGGYNALTVNAAEFEAKIREGIDRLNAAAQEKIAEQEAPIPMLLFCPRCEHQHIDAPEPETGWTNPPHAERIAAARPSAEARIKALRDESERLDWFIDNCDDPPWETFGHVSSDEYRIKSRAYIDAARKK